MVSTSSSSASSSSVQPQVVVAATTRQSQHHPKHEPSHVVRNSLIAGSIAGVVSTLVCHPFDVIRTKMQSAAMESPYSATTTTSTTTTTTTTSATASARSSGPVSMVSQTIKQGGLRALYTGLALPLAAQAVYKATVFTVNNVTQTSLVHWNTRKRLNTGNVEPYTLTMTDRFICGFMGGAVNAAFFVTPVEYVRNQLIAHHTRRASGQKVKNIFRGPLDVIKHTLQESPRGFGGLWKGVGVTIARDSIGCGCFFYAMAWSQQRLAAAQAGTEGRPPTLGATICSGALAGLAYWVAALPLDTVKTWVQSDMAVSATRAVQMSLRDHGPWVTMHRMTSGYQVAYARGIPSAAITVTTYSFCYTAVSKVAP